MKTREEEGRKKTIYQANSNLTFSTANLLHFHKKIINVDKNVHILNGLLWSYDYLVNRCVVSFVVVFLLYSRLKASELL